MKEALLIGMVGALAASLAACKPKQAIKISTTAYIVGPTNDIKPIDKTTRTEVRPDALKAAALIATQLADGRLKFCSGTLIGPAAGETALRVVSNHHCFAVADNSDKATPELLPEACVKTRVYFDFLLGETAQATSLGCQPGSLRTNFGGDLSVLTLTQNPPAEHQPLAIYPAETLPADKAALIVHFPDVPANMALPPDGAVKLPTAAVTKDDCRIVGPFDEKDWDLDRTLAFSVRHTCDLIHGSSGSGLIDAETGMLLGVNWGGIKVQRQTGISTDNVATGAPYLRAFLEGRVESLTRSVADARLKSGDVPQATRQEDAEAHKAAKGKELQPGGCGVVAGGAAATGVGLVAVLLVPLLALGRGLWTKRPQRVPVRVKARAGGARRRRG